MKSLLTTLLLCFTTACSITKEVDPIPADVVIDRLYVQQNTKDHMAEFINELASQLAETGIPVERYVDAKPAGTTYHLEYKANWKWDLGMYLSYFHATVFRHDVPIGSCEYDARSGGANMGKFGATAEKIRPLLSELFGRSPASGDGEDG